MRQNPENKELTWKIRPNKDLARLPRRYPRARRPAQLGELKPPKDERENKIEFRKIFIQFRLQGEHGAKSGEQSTYMENPVE